MTTATPSNELRQRATKSSANSSAKADGAAKPAAAASPDASAVGILDIIRALAGVALVSTIGSYAVTHGESLTWGLFAKKPWWMDVKAVRAALKGPLLLTNDQLASYDGSDPSKPILLALNRTIYDVSSSPQVYGPGGMYSVLAAKDASRSYITTCFDPADDLVPYFGGVEEVYVPLWLSRRPPKDELAKMDYGDLFGGKDGEDLIDLVHKKVGRKNIKPLREKAYEKAKERVREQVRTWEGMFAKKGYTPVGRVIGVDEEDPTKWRHLSFCEDAKNQRPDLASTLQEAMDSLGKGDQMKLNLGNMGKRQDDDKKRKKKKKKSKKAAKDRDTEFKIKMGLEDDPDEEDESAILAEKANVRIEDMLKGGKYYPKPEDLVNKDGSPKQIEDVIREVGGDEETIQKALKMLKEKKASGEIPDTVQIPDL